MASSLLKIPLLLFLIFQSKLFVLSDDESEDQKIVAKDVSNVLELIFKDYNFRTRPCGELEEEKNPQKSGGSCQPTKVKISVYLRSIDDIDDKNQNFVLELTFRQSWMDKRLKFSKEGGGGDQKLPSYLSLASDDKKYTPWLPDTVFVNEKMAARHTLDKNNIMTRVAPSGKVTYGFRFTPTLQCRMDFKHFPRDQHHCFMDISSYVHTNQHILYKWNDTSAILMSPTFKNNIADFEILEVKRDACKTEASMGTFSCARLNFHMRRVFNLAQFVTLYFPGCAIVLLAWLSLWFGNVALISRVATILCCFSTLIIHAALVAPELPAATSFRSWDIWFSACLILIILILIQLLISYRMFRNEKPIADQVQLQAPNVTSLSSQMSQIYSPSVVSFSDGEHPLKITLPKKSTPGTVMSKKSVVNPWPERRVSAQMDSQQVTPLLEDAAKEENGALKMRKVNPVVKMWRSCTRSEKFDVICRIVFFVAFCLFNILYWSH